MRARPSRLVCLNQHFSDGKCTLIYYYVNVSGGRVFNRCVRKPRRRYESETKKRNVRGRRQGSRSSRRRQSGASETTEQSAPSQKMRL